MLIKEQFLNLKDNTISENVTLFLLCLLAMFPILPPSVQSISLILFSILSIIFNFNNIKSSYKNRKKLKIIIIITSFYILSLFSFFWTSDKYQFYKEIQPNLSLIIVPFVFIYFIRLNESTVSIIKNLFIISFIGYVIFLWFPNFIFGIEFYFKHIDKTNNSFIDQNYFTQFLMLFKMKKEAIEGITPDYMSNLGLMQSNYNLIFMHHTYVSSIALFVILLILDSKYYLILKILSLLTLIMFMYFNESKVNILLLIILLPFFMVFKYKFIKPKYFLLIFSVIFIALIYNFSNHFQLFQKKFNINESKYIIDYIRYLLYKSSFEISKENFLYGVGLGDIVPALNQKLNSPINASIFGYNPQFNPHSDYFKFLLTGGICNLFLFLTAIIYLIYKTICKKQYLFTCFILIVFSNSLFECFLSRFWGALFFSFFTSIFINSNLLDESK